MKCPVCRADSRVLRTEGKDRRRQCKADPTHRFWTREQVILKGRKANHDLRHGHGLGPNGPSILNETKLP